MKAGSFFLFLSGWALLAGSMSCKTGVPEAPSAPVLRVQTLITQHTEVIDPVRAGGKLASRTEAKLSFKTGGVIREILVDEGQYVEEGQVMARLDLEEIRSRVNQAELILNKAERDHARAVNLYRDSVATLEQLENARTALEVARSDARIARFNLEYSSIRAPSAGKILKRLAEVNEIISPGFPVFLFASTQGDWIVRTNLADRDVVRINMLDSSELAFDAYPGEKFAGLVSEIGTGADPYTGTYEVEIQLTGKPDRMVSGLIAGIKIFPAKSGKKIILPMECLVGGAGMTGYVYVLEEGKPRRTKIRVSRFLDDGMVVDSGLDAGQEVVTVGARYLSPDSRIQKIGSE